MHAPGTKNKYYSATQPFIFAAILIHQEKLPDNSLNYYENWISYVPHLMKHYRYHYTIFSLLFFFFSFDMDRWTSGWIEFPPIHLKPSVTYNVIKCDLTT